MLNGSPSTYRFVLDSSLSRSIRDLKVSPSAPDDGDWGSCAPEEVGDA
jgi:hypothetical protein